MAGATNRAMKAAGVPKATIATLRVEHGGHLSLRSALSIAKERGLDTGKAHDFMAARDSKKAAAPAAQAATADFRSKAAATMKAAGERTAKEGRAAMLAARLRDRAANALGTDRGETANARAERVLKANPGARGLSEQLRGERRFETKSAVNQTMRLGQVSRSNFNLPATRSERVAGLLGAMKAKEAQSAARRADMRAEAGAKPFDGAMGKFKAHAQKQIDDYYKAQGFKGTPPTLHYSEGEKYIRVTKVDAGAKTGSAHSFIDKATGDVLKPDGFKRPAKGARGNIFSGDFGVNEHGANYSAAYMKRRSATDFYAPPSRGPSKREKQAIQGARDVILGPRAAAKPAMAGARPFDADRHKTKAQALSDARKAQLATASARLQAAKTPEDRQSASKAMAKAQDAVDRAGALNRGASAMVGARDRAALVAKARNAAKTKERASLPAVAAQIGRTLSTSRAALEAAPRPKKGLENIVRTDNGTPFVQGVKPLHQKGDFFVHKGIGGGYSVTHRPTGLSVGNSAYLSTARGMMEGLSKTGSKALSRIQAGDVKATAAFKRYSNMTRKSNYAVAAGNKYLSGR